MRSDTTMAITNVALALLLLLSLSVAGKMLSRQ